MSERTPSVFLNETHWIPPEVMTQKRKEEKLMISMWLLAILETETIDGGEGQREKAIEILRTIPGRPHAASSDLFNAKSRVTILTEGI